MASHPDDEAEAGPSGLETTSDLLCHGEMGDSEEDDLCNDLLDHLERQHVFQTNLLEQSGGALDNAQGAFEFELDPYVDRLSRRMGVRERHFKTQLRQRGNFIDDENITQALQDGLRRAVNQVLATILPSVPTISQATFMDGVYKQGNGAKEVLVWTRCSIGWPKPSTATNNLKWTIRFNCPSPKSIMRLREPANRAVANPATPPWKC